MQTIALARNAMATRFELLLHGENPFSLRAAGEEALDEIDRLEARLSLYRPTSEISRINARAAQEAVRVSPEVFQLLQRAKNLSTETAGAFDITIAPLVRCWGFMGGAGKWPDASELAGARSKVGMSLVELDERNFTVRFFQPGMMLDLGAIGKGYALECAAESLREAGVTSALLHGGTSTIYALGHPPGADAWRVNLESAPKEDPAEKRAVLATVCLNDEALSVSAIWGRSFKKDGKTYGHVLDPRTGEPVCGTLLSAVVLPGATETDAISTALLVAGEPGHGRINALRPGMRSLVLTEDAASSTGGRISEFGIPPQTN